MEKNTLFTFESADPKIVTIGLSPLGREKIEDVTSVIEDLMDNIDQNFRTEGYLYDIRLSDDEEGIEIRPFEDGDEFNQDVFNVISEELEFMDNLVGDTNGIEDEM